MYLRRNVFLWNGRRTRNRFPFWFGSIGVVLLLELSVADPRVEIYLSVYTTDLARLKTWPSDAITTPMRIYITLSE